MHCSLSIVCSPIDFMQYIKNIVMHRIICKSVCYTFTSTHCILSIIVDHCRPIDRPTDNVIYRVVITAKNFFWLPLYLSTSLMTTMKNISVSAEGGPRSRVCSPSTLVEIFRCTCPQNHLKTSPPSPEKSYPRFRTLL